MSVQRIHLLPSGIWAVVLAAVLSAGAAEPVAAPDFQEVFEIVRTNITGMDAAALNRAALQGFATQLAPRVAIVSAGAVSKGQEADAAPLGLVTTYDGIGYVRVLSVGGGLADSFKRAVETLSSTNKLKGLVLDLRYAGGTNYAVAAGVAGQFAKKKQALLNWGEGMKETEGTAASVTVPSVVLVNGETRRAAEALAAVLRETGSALVLGSKTAGQALIFKQFPLKNGEILEVGTAPIELGNGTKLNEDGLTPDIPVHVTAEEGKAWYSDPFATVTHTNQLTASVAGSDNGTNRVRRPRLNEAELVRERRDGIIRLEGGSGPEAEAGKPGVQDPVLLRALDVLKGLAVIRRIGS